MNTRRRRVAPIIALAGLLIFSGCGAADLLSGSDPEAPTPVADTTAAAPAGDAPAGDVTESAFTEDGTFQSHIEIDGIDFVLTIWPTKATPRTHEWFPLGAKHFSFTLTAYDLDRQLDDSFDTKRRVWLGQVRVNSETTRSGGGASESPYTLDDQAKNISFDPEPRTSRWGMLITSPKGAFEMRNQVIGDLAEDTTGVTLIFEATVNIQDRPDSDRYSTELVRQEVPISIFASDTATESVRIPFNAN